MALTSVKESDPEGARLAALRSYAVLDTPAEPEFDEIARLASVACNTPVSAISLVDAGRCWFKAKVGLDLPEVPRGASICGYAFGSSGIFVVPDARRDERFNRMPLITEAGFQFYAGVPLIDPAGHSLGTLCVLDYQPRVLSTTQLATLRSLADHAMKLFELHRARQAAAPAAVPPAAIAAPAAEAAVRVLVVDDDDMVRSFVRKLVARLGYEVIEAANGVEALEQMEKSDVGIGLVLTDVNMPVMDGLALVRVLKKRPVPPAIVVMSGRFDSSLRSVLRAEGITALLGKPFSTDELELTLLQAKAPAA